MSLLAVLSGYATVIGQQPGTVNVQRPRVVTAQPPLSIAIPGEIQCLTSKGEDVAAKSEKPAVVAEGAKPPANDVERIEL